MDMMFINDKCFRDDVKPFIDFRRKLFVPIWKFKGQFFIGQLVFDDACRKSIEVCFALSFCF